MSMKTGFKPERDIIGHRVGDLDLKLLTDAYIEIEGTSVFSPATLDQWSGRIGHGEMGTFIIPVRSLLLNNGDGFTLVDTGFGENYESDRELSLNMCLDELGIATTSVTEVIITHLHGDHFLGNTVQGPDGWSPRFPEAVYYAPEKDALNMTHEEKILWKTRFEPIEESGKLVLVTDETSVSPSVTLVPTPGHTEGHMSVRITSASSSALFLGDLGLHRLNMEKPEWGPDWAWSREHDIANRRCVTAGAADSGEVIIAGHDPDEPIFTLERAGDEFVAIPVP